MDETLNLVVNLFSIYLTPYTMLAAVGVIVLWMPAFVRAISNPKKGERDWFVIGVTIGFAGAFMDNLYWGVAWAAHVIQSPYEAWIFEHGSYSNVVFRQAFGIVAGLCHVTAAVTDSRTNPTRSIMQHGTGFGLALVMTLLYLRDAF